MRLIVALQISIQHGRFGAGRVQVDLLRDRAAMSL